MSIAGRPFALEALRADHEPQVRAFELANRAYFARSVSDRGDAFFERFTDEHRGQLAAQDAGTCAFHVLVDDHGDVVGRVNLYRIADGSAELGYRIAERVAGQGVATEAVRELCVLAREQLRLRRLTAATSDVNVASRRVLIKAGFVPGGPCEVGGRPGRGFTLQLDTARPADDGRAVDAP